MWHTLVGFEIVGKYDHQAVMLCQAQVLESKVKVKMTSHERCVYNLYPLSYCGAH